MTLQAFINKNLGKALDFDNAYGAQCVDLVQFYNRDVCNAPRLTGNAKDIWNSYPKDVYDQVANTPTNFPQTGDIVIWNQNVGGGNGHIAICVLGESMSFTSFDQNWSGVASHFQQHDYTNVQGWLHPKK